MIKSKAHKLILKKERFDMVSADTDFYKFVDDTRLYYTFERFVRDEDRPLFVERVAKGYEQWFVVHLVALDGAQVPCYMNVKAIPNTDNVEVSILDIGMLVESEKKLDTKSRIDDSVMRLYGDDIFIYNHGSGDVTINSEYGAGTDCVSMSLEELQRILEESVEEKDSVAGFIGGLKNGGRYLYIKTNGSVKDRESDICTVLLSVQRCMRMASILCPLAIFMNMRSVATVMTGRWRLIH